MSSAVLNHLTVLQANSILYSIFAVEPAENLLTKYVVELIINHVHQNDDKIKIY